MSDSKKLISAREAALLVLAKTKEILAKSDLAKYETENSTRPDVKYGPIETKQKALERDYKEYEVKSGSSKDSSGPRLAKQISPSKNPKEEAEGNNNVDGMEPRYEFKDKVKGDLAKEKASHMDKAENPDLKADAQLGEKVEHDVEEHMSANKEAEAKEGHDMAKPEQKSEAEQASIPRLVLSAKLSKFCEHMHSKRKNAQAQSAAAVGHNGPDAPAPRSSESGRPDISKSEMEKHGLSTAEIKAKIGK